jgi:hypothetical protein
MEVRRVKRIGEECPGEDDVGDNLRGFHGCLRGLPLRRLVFP